jgi:hypothetical protein
MAGYTRADDPITIVLCGGQRDGQHIRTLHKHLQTPIETPEIDRPSLAHLAPGFRLAVWEWDGTRTHSGLYRFREKPRLNRS